jgi:protein O-GlcNAc transferase
MTQGRLNDAIEHFSKALRCNPDHRAAQSVMLYLMQKTCRWDDLHSNIESLRHSISTADSSAESVVAPFLFLSLPGTTLKEQKLCAEKWVRSEYQALSALRQNLAFNHRRPRNGKIVIGYLSADFREHPVARMMAEVFELHDRDQFHTIAYSYGPDDGSEMRKRLQNAFDQFVDIRSDSDVDAARRIYADNVSILVDLTGYTESTRSGILALRPAPLQLNYLGYEATMGADFVDYLIADHFLVPPEHQMHCTEKILYLPNCFQPTDRTRPRLSAPSRASCGLSDGNFVFCCFNQTYKITPEVFDIWCRLLIAVPDSILWLFASTPYSEENLKREAKSRGVDPLRLVMAPMLEPAQHLARIQCADLFLDTTPINAGTTCSDALWMGLPIVTYSGESLSSRMAGSLLSAMGVPELITYNLKDYYNLAVNLATDRKTLASIRRKIIANRDTAPLFDSVRFTHDLESAYIKLMEEYFSSTNSK